MAAFIKNEVVFAFVFFKSSYQIFHGGDFFTIHLRNDPVVKIVVADVDLVSENFHQHDDLLAIICSFSIEVVMC